MRQKKEDVATCDIPHAFIQTQVEEQDEDGNQNIMKIREFFLILFVDLIQSTKIMHIMKAIYGLHVSAVVFYQELTTDLTKYSFEINPYDPCVANKQVEGKQMTSSWNVDDLKISHASSKVVDEFIKWIKPRMERLET